MESDPPTREHQADERPGTTAFPRSAWRSSMPGTLTRALVQPIDTAPESGDLPSRVLRTLPEVSISTGAEHLLVHHG
jgi:hypothetical protein